MTTKEIRHNNAIIRISRPTLTDAERQKREANLERALQIVGKELVQKGVI